MKELHIAKQIGTFMITVMEDKAADARKTAVALEGAITMIKDGLADIEREEKEQAARVNRIDEFHAKKKAEQDAWEAAHPEWTAEPVDVPGNPGLVAFYDPESRCIYFEVKKDPGASADPDLVAKVDDTPPAAEPELELRREPFTRHPTMVPVVVEDERTRRKAGR